MRKIETSKVIVFLSFFIFCSILIASFLLGLQNEYGMDSNIIITSISVSGGIAGASAIFYYRKSQGDNSYKIRIALYKECSETRLHFNEEMLKIKMKYNVSDEDIQMLDNESDMDEMMNSALESTKKIVDDLQDESEQMVDIQNFG